MHHLSKMYVDDDINEKELMYLYTDLQMTLGLIPSYGEEGIIADIAHGTFNIAKSTLGFVGRKLGKLISRLFLSLRQLTENIFRRYDSLINKRLKMMEQRVGEVNENKFLKYKTHIVPCQVLKDRVSAALSVYSVLNNIESIFNHPVKRDSEDWRTPEFINAYSDMAKIGFDADRYALLKAPLKTYDKARVTKTLETLGYTPTDILDIVRSIAKFSNYASKTYTESMIKRFIACADKLSDYEQMISKAEDTMSEDQIESMRHNIQIKTARLWWMSHFIKAIYVVTNDILVDALKVANIFERCVEGVSTNED